VKLVTLIMLVFGLAAPAPAQASSYLTVSFGRAQVGVVPAQKQCAAIPPVSMPDVLAYLQSRGLVATMDVQLSLTAETTETCQGTIKYASWQDLQLWHLLYNTEAVSAGDVVTDYSKLTDAQVLQHSCGTLQAFTDHGFNRATGMFASPSNSATAHQLTLFDSCFGLVRAYNLNKPTLLSKLVAPFKAFTYSLTGGRCNNAALPCYGMTIKNARVYPDPDALIAQFNATPDNAWLNLQAYRFVIGTNTAANGWDCSSTDWHDHYTVLPEMFCYNDYQHIIDNLRVDFVPVDPAAIAGMVGR
jgi:hypothetical protein